MKKRRNNIFNPYMVIYNQISLIMMIKKNKPCQLETSSQGALSTRSLIQRAKSQQTKSTSQTGRLTRSKICLNLNKLRIKLIKISKTDFLMLREWKTNRQR